MKTGFRIQDMAIIALDAALLCVLAPLAIPAGPVPFTLATLAVYPVSYTHLDVYKRQPSGTRSPHA